MPKNKAYQNSEQDRRLIMVEDHIGTINHELGDVKIDLAEVKKDVSWLKKSYWVIATASIGALAGALINLFLK